MPYKLRNKNPRTGSAPESWSQRFYDSRRDRRERAEPCGFRLPEKDKP